MLGNGNAGNPGADDHHVLGHHPFLRYSPGFNMTAPSRRTPTRVKNKPLPRSRFRATPLALVVLALVLYAGTIAFPYVLDDDVITRGHHYVEEGLSGISHIFATNYLYGFDHTVDLAYRPVPLSSTALEVALYGNRPSRHHLGNVLLYALLALVTWWSLRNLLGREHPELPWMATALFLVHPVHTEVVANIKGREELCAALFGLASLGLLFHGQNRNRTSVSPRWLLVSLVAYLAALFSKETAYAFFPITLLALVAFAKLDRRRVITVLGGYAAVTVLSVLVRFAVSRHPGLPVGPPTVMNNALVAAHGWGERLATISEICLRYLGLLFLPHHLSFDYSYNAVPIVSWSDPRALAGLLLLLASIALIWLSWRRGERAVAFFIALIWLALVPGLNLFYLTGTTMAERFLFVSCLGVAGLIALGLEAFWGRSRSLAIGLLAVLVVGGSVGTFIRARDWRSNESLFRAALRTTPASARVHHHLASVLREQGEGTTDPPRRQALLRQAVDEYTAALEIQPDFAEATYNLGVTHYDLAETTAAQTAYERTLTLEPEHANALINLGVIAFQRKDAGGAEAFFARAVAKNPWNVLAVTNLGASLATQGNLEGARQVYARGLEHSPDDPRLLQCLAEIATRMNDATRAKIYQDRLTKLAH
jgi:Tfp pilus assembly protein PilF